MYGGPEGHLPIDCSRVRTPMPHPNNGEKESFLLHIPPCKYVDAPCCYVNCGELYRLEGFCINFKKDQLLSR